MSELSNNHQNKNTGYKRVRMKDIAEALNLSLSTVSRALNPETANKISHKVVDQVNKVAKELGYISDVTAAGLRRQRTYTAGMIVPDLLNPIFPPIIRGVDQYLSSQGYATFTMYSDNDIDIATKEIQKLISRRVDGIIMAGAFLTDSSVNYCLEQGTPLVLVNRSIREGHRVQQVLDDDAYGISLAIDYLYKLGHRHLIHMAGPQDILHGTERLQAFINCCEKKEIDYEVIHVNAFSLEAGKRGAEELIQRKVPGTALLAGNDLIAVGAIKVLNEYGKRVPEDISVIGFNDMPLADMLNPPLTTISIPHESLGEQAAKLLIEQIETGGGPIQKVLLTPKLTIRESCQAIN